jgi:hypothetical protein
MASLLPVLADVSCIQGTAVGGYWVCHGVCMKWFCYCEHNGRSFSTGGCIAGEDIAAAAASCVRRRNGLYIYECVDIM